MITQTLIKKTLPESTLGRSEGGLFSNPKDLTVIMVPFERFSPFAKAVDDLYKTMDVPFNLIVVEGNAPESVRASLEKCKRKHKNITIIYSTRQTSVGAAINLAVPHLKTQYAFIIDNDVRIPRGGISGLLKGAAENQFGIVCPQNYAVLARGEKAENSKVQSLGVRTCFLISREAIIRLGKFDETMTPFTMEIDIRMSAEELGIRIWSDTSTCIELESENFLWPEDAALHSFQWNEARVMDSFKGLEKKWGIRLQMQDYAAWLMGKKRDLLELRRPFFFLAGLFSKIRSFNQERVQRGNAPEFLFPKAA